MPDAVGNGNAYDVVCPHCKKPFRGELIPGAAPRYEGFKCPHCRLFSPFERVGADELKPE
jgi:hypothetical protein